MVQLAGRVDDREIQEILSHVIEATCSRSQMFIADRGDGWAQDCPLFSLGEEGGVRFCTCAKTKEPGEGDSPGSMSIVAIVFWGIGLHLRGRLCRNGYL